MHTSFSKSLLTCAVSLALSSQLVFAQQSPDAEQAKPANDNTEVIIVSGTPGGIGIRKIDASFAVTNLDAKDIEKLAPKSTADPG